MPLGIFEKIYYEIFFIKKSSGSSVLIIKKSPMPHIGTGDFFILFFYTTTFTYLQEPQFQPKLEKPAKA